MASRRKTISERDFQALVRKFKNIRDSSESASVDSNLEAYWTYGNLIVEKGLLEDVGYHHSVLRDLSMATGISVRLLQDSVAFRKSYDEPPSGAGLSWAHIRALATLPSKKLRDFYSRLTRQHDWTSTELRKAIAAELHAGGKRTKAKLKRPTEADYLYQAKEARVIDADTIEVLIDLGFHSFTLQRVRLAQINAPELRTAPGRAARNFLAESLADAQTLVVQTRKSDLHGRYVAHVFASPRKMSIDTCFRKGHFINDLLLRNKHARLVG